MASDFIRPFARIGKADAAIAGGKGASLGEMTQAGISVPPGYVILSDAFEQFLAETDLNIQIAAILDTVDTEAVHTVESASEQIQTLILAAKMPEEIASVVTTSFKELGAEFVAVRSSATAEDSAAAAWAGQLDTYLNTTDETLLENVQRCWASLFTPRAIFYRFEKGLHATKISVAVVVQKMVNSDAAGIAFSVHPVTEDYNQLIIEAGFGLGEAVVSGQVTPDSYVVTKEPREILNKNISEQTRGIYRKEGGGNEWRDIPASETSKQVLTDSQILALTETVIGIEKHYGFPVDIEWAMEDSVIYITQSRPITTLSHVASVKSRSVYERFFSRDFCLASVEAWVRGECTNPKQWSELSQPFLPYIVMQRSDDTVHAYYDHRGVQWVQDLLARRAKEDKGFLKEIEGAVLEKIEYLQPLYESEETLPEAELRKFIRELESGYPWFEAMWWLCQMDEKKLTGVDIRAMQRLRTRTNALSNGSDSVIRKSLANIHPEFGSLASMLRTSEIISGKTPDIGELQDRDKGYFFTDNTLFVGVDVPAIERKFGIEFLKKDIDGSFTVLSGEIAQRGVVRGVVRRVMGHKQIGQIREGEILVSPMTMPDFLPAMIKAAAFVTDEGGITCHAAIVARELKKPCVIGTKFATQIFKDGDLVEVDAEKGIIRKI